MDINLLVLEVLVELFYLLDVARLHIVVNSLHLANHFVHFLVIEFVLRFEAIVLGEQAANFQLIVCQPFILLVRDPQTLLSLGDHGIFRAFLVGESARSAVRAPSWSVVTI